MTDMKPVMEITHKLRQATDSNVSWVSLSVADPAFPVGGAPTSWGDANS